MRYLIIFFLLFPTIAEAQIEIGFDVGLSAENSGGFRLVSYHIPTKYLRIGVPGRTISFESLVSISHKRVLGEHQTVIEVLPGIVYHRGEYYTRAEVGMLLDSSSFGWSSSQFAYGGAVGRKQRIGKDSSTFWYVETGVDKWVGNIEYAPRSVFRFLVGLSVVIG